MTDREMTTQGSIKFKQYVEDLLRNKHFMSTAEKLMTAYKSRKTFKNSADKEFDNLVEEYKKLDTKSKKWKKKYYAEFDRLSGVMAEDYGLDNELLRPVLISLSSLKDGDFKKSMLYDYLLTDLCLCIDNYEEYLNAHFPTMSLALNTSRQSHLKAFPISIDIHRFATKRDVLDFIEKKWAWIENQLGQYKEYKNIKFRRRKLDRKITDYIWDNRSLPAKELKASLDKEFPNNGLVYYELNKLKNLEKHRRNRKIIVGR